MGKPEIEEKIKSIKSKRKQTIWCIKYINKIAVEYNWSEETTQELSSKFTAKIDDLDKVMEQFSDTWLRDLIYENNSIVSD